MMYIYTRIWLLLILISHTITVSAVESSKVESLYLALAGNLTEQESFDTVDFSKLNNLLFVSNPIIMDLRIEESITDYTNFIVERAEIGIVGNVEINSFRLTREDFLYRIELVLKHIENNGFLPQVPLTIEIKHLRKGCVIKNKDDEKKKTLQF